MDRSVLMNYPGASPDVSTPNPKTGYAASGGVFDPKREYKSYFE
jgi:hypothetical protein